MGYNPKWLEQMRGQPPLTDGERKTFLGHIICLYRHPRPESMGSIPDALLREWDELKDVEAVTIKWDERKARG